MLGLIGKKLGMMRVFTDTASLPVTVVAVTDNRIAQIKTVAKDGYESVQLAFGSKNSQNINKPRRGHLAKYQVGAAATLREFRNYPMGEGVVSGESLSADVFAAGDKVDVTGVSKGKGFAGVIKRHHFSGNRSSHGNSRAHRKPGSTGQCQDPGRTFPGKKMPGRLGGKQRTMQNLQVVRVDTARGLLLIKGAVPGAPGGTVLVRAAVKGGAVKGEA